MAGNLYSWSETAASNSSADSTINWAEGQLPGTVNDSSRAMMAVHAAFLADTNATKTTSGTGAAYTVTSSLTSTLATGLKLRLKMNASNTGACTLNVTPAGGAAFGAKAIKVLDVGGEADPDQGAIQANGVHEFNYDSAANSAAGAWILLNPSRATASRISSFNCGLAVSASTSALTIAVKTLAGSDPSAADPVFVHFRSATGTTGTVSPLAITAATSLVISAGSTLGTANATAFRVWIVGFNDAGTFRLGAVQNGTGIGGGSTFSFSGLADGIASSTAEGGAGAADTAGVIYTGSAVSSKAMRILGYAEWNSSGVTSAGTWTTSNLATIQIFEPGIPKPGDIIQVVATSSSPNATAATTTYSSTGSTRAITPTSAANMIWVRAGGILYTDTAGTAAFGQISRGTTANTNMLGASAEATSNGGTCAVSANLFGIDFPNTTSSTTYAVQYKNGGTGTVGWGNTNPMFFEASEVMV